MATRPSGEGSFQLQEATIGTVHEAFARGELSAQELVSLYTRRIEKYDQDGPNINAVISLHPEADECAAQLDRHWADEGPVGPLHGVPVILKDQMDVLGVPTTLGATPLEDYQPGRDAFVVQRLKAAGAVILAKATLGELGRGDAHGTLFGSTANPYALDRTSGGSSGGSAAALAANFALAGLGQEGMASIRRPSGWNCVVGMRPSAGLVSRSGVFAGWPGIEGSVGPMARTVKDAAILLDAVVGYDPDDPLTAVGAGRVDRSFVSGLEQGALRSARLGVIREPIGHESDPESNDYQEVDEVFEQAVQDLRAAGATLVDPVEIPNLKSLLAKRSGVRGGSEAAFTRYFSHQTAPPFGSFEELLSVPGYSPVGRPKPIAGERSMEHILAREELMFHFMKLIADQQLDGFVHRTVEHSPTLISDGLRPPYVDRKGAPHLNTFLVYVPSISVPAGFTREDMPVGMTFLGPPYSDRTMVGLAYSYEQATLHRKPPRNTPPLPEEP